MKNLATDLGTRSAWSCLTCGFSSLTWIQTAVVALTKPQYHDGSAYTGPSCLQCQAAGPCRDDTSGPALFKSLWNSAASDYGKTCSVHPEASVPHLLPYSTLFLTSWARYACSPPSQQSVRTPGHTAASLNHLFPGKSPEHPNFVLWKIPSSVQFKILYTFHFLFFK